MECRRDVKVNYDVYRQVTLYISLQSQSGCHNIAANGKPLRIIIRFTVFLMFTIMYRQAFGNHCDVLKNSHRIERFRCSSGSYKDVNIHK